MKQNQNEYVHGLFLQKVQDPFNNPLTHVKFVGEMVCNDNRNYLNTRFNVSLCR